MVYVVCRESGWEAVMRIRAGKGWRINKWFGNFNFRGSDLMVLPSCNGDQSFGFMLQPEEGVHNMLYFRLR